MESQTVDQMELGFGLLFGGGSVGGVLEQENTRPKSHPGAHDDRLEQSAYGLFRALLDRASVEAPGGAPVSPSVDAAERASCGGRPMTAGSTRPAMEQTTGRE